MKDLTISHAVRHTAQNVASVKMHRPLPVPFRHEVFLNPDQIERDVWIVAQSVDNNFAVKSTLRFYLDAELVAEIPNSRGNAPFPGSAFPAGEELLVGINTAVYTATTTTPTPAGGRQPTISFHVAEDPRYQAIVPSFFVRVRATRAVLTIEQGYALGSAISGVVILSQYP